VEIIISNSSDKPIYEQISTQIKNAILSGELATGQALPSIRSLASDLHVSVITTKRAYSDLEALGFIETRQGKGSFVAGGNVELLREEQLRHIESLLQEALNNAETARVSLPELHDILDTLAES
jgi:GntR family transcriptional regulator